MLFDYYSQIIDFQALSAIREIFDRDVGKLCLFPEILYFYPDPGLSFRDPEAAVIKGRMFQPWFNIIGESESFPGYFNQFIIHPVIAVFIVQQTDCIGPWLDIIQDDLHHSFLEGGFLKIKSPGRIDRKLVLMIIQA